MTDRFTLDKTKAAEIIAGMTSVGSDQVAVDAEGRPEFLGECGRPGQAFGDLLDDLADAITSPDGWKLAVDSIEDNDGDYYLLMVMSREVWLTFGPTEVAELLDLFPVEEDGRRYAHPSTVLVIAEELIDAANELLFAARQKFAR